MSAAPLPCPALEAGINAARAEAGLPPLVPHPALRAAAMAHAADLLGNGAFDHAGSDSSLPMERVMRQGLSPRLAAENIAMGQPDAAAAVAAWQGSEGHRANNLEPTTTLVGAAEARYGRLGLVSDDQPLWIAVFAAGF
ncbi:CAP domain-containing protein [Albimonas pacifica]|uniref:Cysteine-rich secretory protein family protein n=1 Tax=Albimonas pacifica TaxID=1114924 RepID=A0A1I3BT89_9RHOB|nr:CAP domain-containing protein [Albimonas pacifica]SFH65296.1 Cysteine-rich secretory protein family protein [Albimonas pacifica]